MRSSSGSDSASRGMAKLSATPSAPALWRSVIVRFVIGEFDPYVSAAELEEFEVRELQGVGHLVNLERPDEFNEILREFVDSV